MEKIIVTGGAGFIGSHTVVELLKAGFEPIIVDNFINSHHSVIQGLQKITGRITKHYEVDCNDKEAFSKVFEIEKKISGVIHFAAYKAVGESVQNPLKYYYNNLNSLIVLLEVMQKYKTKNLVFSSSCTVYGQPDKLPVNEETPVLKANSPYGNTKQICEEILQDATISGIPVRTISLRYFNPVGAHPTAHIGELPIGTPNNLVPYITQTAAGLRSKLTVFGGDYNTKDGTCVRDFIHVVDLANAHVKAFELLAKQNADSYYEVFNVGTGAGNTVLEVIGAFEKVSGQKLNYAIGPRRDGDVEQIYAEVKKAEEILKWKAELSLEDSLRDAWRWQKTLPNKVL
jgi:UDP-glucose 4-epimerase